MMEELLVITREYYGRSPLSVIMQTGVGRINGHVYEVMPPCYDLVRSDLVKAYIKLGRDKIVSMIIDHKSSKEINAIADERKEIVDTQLSLF